VLNPQGRAAQAPDTAGAIVYASKALLAGVAIVLIAMFLVAEGGAP
jgi:hypothetical protein